VKIFIKHAQKMLAAGHLNEWELGENFFLGVGVGEEGQRAFA